MANGDWDPSKHARLRKTNVPGYFVNDSGIIVNDDELAWMKYKAEREAAKVVQRLVKEIEQLKMRVSELERRDG